MLFAVLLGLVVAVAAQPSGYSVCIPSTATPVPSTIISVISSADYSYPSIYTIFTVLSTVELISPPVYTAELTIESYEPSYYSVISEIESMYDYPSLYTDSTYVQEFTEAYTAIASAVSVIVSAELTQTALASYQSTIQYVETEYPTILTAGFIYVGDEYPSVYTAEYVISQATLTDSSVFPDLIAIGTLVSYSPTISNDIASLSYYIYTMSYTELTEVQTWFVSPSTVGSSTLSSLYVCNSAAYYEIKQINSWIASHSYFSYMPLFATWAGSVYYVPYLDTAVETIVSYDMPTFTYDVSVISDALSTEPSITLDLSVLTDLVASSPTIYYAESTIEQTFYNTPSVAYVIYQAIDYPSLVTSPTLVQYYEESHESFVTAVTEFTNFECDYPSYYTVLTTLEYELTSAFVDYGTLLTAFTYVQAVTSPSIASATAQISAAATVVSDITYVLSGVSYVISESPTLSCYESAIEYYAEVYPTAASYIWDVINSITYLPASSISSFEYLTASYPTLAYDEYQVVGGEIDYSFLLSLESSFIYAASTDSTLLTDYEYLTYSFTSNYVSLTTYVPTYTVC